MGGPVTSAVFSPDGKAVLTASKDCCARVFCATTTVCGRTYVGHRQNLNSATFSSDGKLVVTASGDGTAMVFHYETGEIQRVLRGHRAAVSSAVFAIGI